MPVRHRNYGDAGMACTRTLSQFGAHHRVDGRATCEHPSTRGALVQAGRNISKATATPDEEIDPEVQKAMDKLFAALTIPGKTHCLDTKRFIAAQVALALLLGHSCDRSANVRMFFELSSHRSRPKFVLEQFSRMQHEILHSRGMDAGTMVEVLHQITQRIENKFGQESNMEKRPQRMWNTSCKATLSNSSQTRSHSVRNPTSRRQGEQRIAAMEDSEIHAMAETMKEHLRHREKGLRSGYTGQRAEIPLKERYGNVEAVESMGTRLYAEGEFRYWSDHGRQAPDEYAASVPELVDYLTRDTGSDLHKAWIIFSWVCHHISYDADGLHGRAKRQSCAPEDVLVSRLSVCAGYAGIFEALASHAGLMSEKISGHARILSTSPGQDVVSNVLCSHAWNAVKLEDECILIDCTWGAGFCTEAKFEAHFRPHFFGIPPRQFAFTHFPEDTSWQLLAQPLSYLDFINQPIVCTDEFFRHRLGFVQSLPSGFINLAGCLAGSLELDVPEDVDVMGKLGDSKAEIHRSSTRVTLHFRMAASLKRADLSIFVRQGDLHGGTYHCACRFVVKC